MASAESDAENDGSHYYDLDADQPGDRRQVMTANAGGYAQRLEDTVTIHSNTVIAAKTIFA